MSELDQKHLIGVAAVAAMTATTHSLWLLTGFNDKTIVPVRKLCEYFTSRGSEEEQELARRILSCRVFDNVTQMAQAWTSFFGLGRMSITPHESVFRCGLAMQEPRDLTRAFMLKAGVKITAAQSEPEDHLGIQLEFLGHLLEQSFENLKLNQSALDLASSFLRERLAWVPDFVAKAKAFPNLESTEGCQIILWLLELLVIFLRKLETTLSTEAAHA